MRLHQFLEDSGLTFTEFGRLVEVSTQSVSRYVAGERIPRPDVMKRIIAATGGVVQPNDFYPPCKVAA